MKISAVVEAKHVVERSRFFAAAFPAEDLEAAKRFVAARQRKHRKACHHCWACRLLDPAGGAPLEQARDDGEVGRPGLALLALLRAGDLEGGVVVSRIFGGVKLGPGGVARAFRAAATLALEEV
jgi:putative IMPACT (imprinted ancient) family translation regulator